MEKRRGFYKFRREQRVVTALTRTRTTLTITATAALGAPIMAADAVTVRVEPSGTVVALVGTGGQGQGLRTTSSQVVGDGLGVTLDDITVIDGDTSMVPYGCGVWGARSAVVTLGAGRLAALAVGKKSAASRRTCSNAVPMISN